MAVKASEYNSGVSALKVEDIKSVYSGKDGKCCCGCSGKYWYASAHRAAASKSRGYEVDDKEVSDRQVKRIFDILMQNADAVEFFGTGYSVVINGRLYSAYIR